MSTDSQTSTEVTDLKIVIESLTKVIGKPDNVSGDSSGITNPTNLLDAVKVLTNAITKLEKGNNTNNSVKSSSEIKLEEAVLRRDQILLKSKEEQFKNKGKYESEQSQEEKLKSVRKSGEERVQQVESFIGSFIPQTLKDLLGFLGGKELLASINNIVTDSVKEIFAETFAKDALSLEKEIAEERARTRKEANKLAEEEAQEDVEKAEAAAALATRGIVEVNNVLDSSSANVESASPGQAETRSTKEDKKVKKPEQPAEVKVSPSLSTSEEETAEGEAVKETSSARESENKKTLEVQIVGFSPEALEIFGGLFGKLAGIGSATTAVELAILDKDLKEELEKVFAVDKASLMQLQNRNKKGNNGSRSNKVIDDAIDVESWPSNSYKLENPGQTDMFEGGPDILKNLEKGAAFQTGQLLLKPILKAALPWLGAAAVNILGGGPEDPLADAASIWVKQATEDLEEVYFAKGGDVKEGKPIIVGEEGPEMFVPNTYGSIVPNNKLTDNKSKADMLANITTANSENLTTISNTNNNNDSSNLLREMNKVLVDISNKLEYKDNKSERSVSEGVGVMNSSNNTSNSTINVITQGNPITNSRLRIDNFLYNRRANA